MLLIITILGTASAGGLAPACPTTSSGSPTTSSGSPTTMICGDSYRFELEGIDAPPRSTGMRLKSALNLNSEWQQPTPARLTANTVITASGLVLTLLSVRMLQGGTVMPGDLVPGQAIIAGVGGGVLLLGGSAMWLTTDFSVGSSDRSGVQKGFAIRGVW
ncbi:MAG: hypothetical protein ACI8RZ_001782 [Myxococcota bacterium]|jgi:hypothetical protein